MMRHTGGCAVGEISTRSRFFSRAFLIASYGGMMPKLLPFVVNHANFARPDPIVHADKTFIDTVLRALSD